MLPAGQRIQKTQLPKYPVHQLGGFILQETEYSSLSIFSSPLYVGASLVAQIVKNLSAVQEIKVDPWVGKITWRREWLPTLVFWLAEFHGQRSMADYSPWSHKEPGTTERQTLLFVGENSMQGDNQGI